MKTIQVLLVEDDPMVREVNRQFIDRVEGFTIIATAKNGIEGFNKMQELKPDLVFMDIFMPEQDGIETLQLMRQQKLAIDCITVTAANDVQTIQTILQLGVFDYIMKPFTFERIEKTLLNYRKYKQKLENADILTQQDLDNLLYQNQNVSEVNSHLNDASGELPKGFNKSTMHKVLDFLKHNHTGASADDVASSIGVARVTARRYLDYMEKQKLIKVDIQYGSIGRPINQYFIEQQ